MKELAGLVLAFLSIMSYFMVATRLSFYQRWPVVHVLGAVAACVWLGFLVARRQRWRRLYAGAALVLSLGLTGLFFWYVADFSDYASAQAAVAVGDGVADLVGDLRLASLGGEPAPVLRPGEDRATLLVFYRGYW